MHFLRVAALAALTALTATGSALAHAKMTGSIPADGATVAAGLAAVEMTFSHPMRLTLVRVHSAASDSDVPLQGALPKTFTGSAKVAVDPLKSGTYEVTWTAVSEDGHVMKGRFGFTVATTPAAQPAQ